MTVQCGFILFDVSISCVWSENGTASLCLKCANQHGPVLTDDVFGTFKFSPDGRWVQSSSILNLSNSTSVPQIYVRGYYMKNWTFWKNWTCHVSKLLSEPFSAETFVIDTGWSWHLSSLGILITISQAILITDLQNCRAWLKISRLATVVFTFQALCKLAFAYLGNIPCAFGWNRTHPLSCHKWKRAL